MAEIVIHIPFSNDEKAVNDADVQCAAYCMWCQEHCLPGQFSVHFKLVDLANGRLGFEYQITFVDHSLATLFKLTHG